VNRDDNFTPSEMRLMNELKGKSRMEQDQILKEWEEWQTLKAESRVM
jgi:hypothetical protein